MYTGRDSQYSSQYSFHAALYVICIHIYIYIYTYIYIYIYVCVYIIIYTPIVLEILESQLATRFTRQNNYILGNICGSKKGPIPTPQSWDKAEEMFFNNFLNY